MSMTHPGETAASVILPLVSAISTFLLIRAWQASRRTQNRKLLFLASASGAFATKGIVTATAPLTKSIHHEHPEVASSPDLAVVGLLVAPPVGRGA